MMTTNVPEMDFYEELMSNAKHDDAGSRLRAASMIMEKCGDLVVADTLRTLSAQMDFDDNEEASAAIERTTTKLDSLIADRRKHESVLYIKRLRDDEILELSNGQVTANDYDYLTSSFYKNGLFDPDIFGGSGKIPTYDDENDKFITKSFGLGMGHIQCPVHVVLEDDYNLIARLLGMDPEDVHKVAKYANYLVMDPGETSYKKFSVMTEKEYVDNKDSSGLVVDIGGDAIYKALKSLDYGDVPERLAFTVIPVISPVTRPVNYSTAEETFYSFPLNDVYDAVVTRANRSRKLTELGAPEIILRNEYRMLDDKVNKLNESAKALFRNTHWSKSKLHGFMFTQLEILRRHRKFGVHKLTLEQLKKTDEIDSLNLFPVTVVLSNASFNDSSISLVDVITHNDSVINDFQQENAIMLPGDVDMDNLDDKTKADIKQLDDTVSRMESYGNDILSAAKVQREACKVKYDEKEGMYMLAS